MAIYDTWADVPAGVIVTGEVDGSGTVCHFLKIDEDYHMLTAADNPTLGWIKLTTGNLAKRGAPFTIATLKGGGGSCDPREEQRKLLDQVRP